MGPVTGDPAESGRAGTFPFGLRFVQRGAGVDGSHECPILSGAAAARRAVTTTAPAAATVQDNRSQHGEGQRIDVDEGLAPPRLLARAACP